MTRQTARAAVPLRFASPEADAIRQEVELRSFEDRAHELIAELEELFSCDMGDGPYRDPVLESFRHLLFDELEDES